MLTRCAAKRAARTLLVVRFLLENGADPNARTKKAREPLFAVYSANVIPLLHEFGADPSVIDKDGNTPLAVPADELLGNHQLAFFGVVIHRSLGGLWGSGLVCSLARSGRTIWNFATSGA